MEKVLLSTFTIKVKNRSNNYTILDRFNGIDDFAKIVEDYLMSVFQTIKATSSPQDSTTLHITLDSPPTVDLVNRRIFGYFSSGVAGDKYKIMNVGSKENILDVDREHGAFRNLFFYIKIPKHTETGGVILQRKSKYGIKILFKNTINDFIKAQGYQDYFIEVNNIIHGKVYRKMITEGKLKKISFIRKKIPGSIEGYYSKNGQPQEIKGTFTTSLSAGSLPENYKQFVNDIFTNPKSERIEITGSEEKFDELEFELELNGKKKTFYVMNRGKIQPDVDVTSNIELVDGEPTLESLVNQAEELFNDIIDMSPKNVVKN